jgi:CDGSH-type Zn-finger protein
MLAAGTRNWAHHVRHLILSRTNGNHTMADVKIEIRKNGPYRIYGDVALVDHEGNPVPIPENRRKVSPEGKSWISLCRCGGSVVKPFCDGTHSRIGFIGAEEAVQKIETTPPSP